MSDPTIRTATVRDAAELAATYRSAYAQNRELGFPAKAASATAQEVAGWIRDDWVFVACETRTTDNEQTDDRTTDNEQTDDRTTDNEQTDDRTTDNEQTERGETATGKTARGEAAGEMLSRDEATGADVRVIGGVRLQPTDDQRVKLSRLAVHEDHKDRGVGGRLVNRGERAVRERGYRVVWLTTPARHPFLPDWYARRGYRATGPYPLPYREYDEVVMEKRLAE